MKEKVEARLEELKKELESASSRYNQLEQERVQLIQRIVGLQASIGEFEQLIKDADLQNVVALLSQSNP